MRLGWIGTLTLVALTICVLQPSPSLGCDFCIDEGSSFGSGPNTYWLAEDNVWVCPAGDSVKAGVPSRLRVEIWYADASCQPKQGVPPDSIWLTYETTSGNVVVQDKAAKVFADDSTDVCGHARVTFPSLSGCGTLRLSLHVAGIFQGTKDVSIRSLDLDGDGRLATVDYPLCAPVGVTESEVLEIFQAHYEHWHRNALHGTPVRRTNYSESETPGSANTIGGGEVNWSPTGRYLTYSAFIGTSGGSPACKIFVVPSGPQDGNALLQITSDPLWKHDYDPNWSPLNNEIVFDRSDSVIIRTPAPWLSGTETAVTASSNFGCDVRRGDNIPAISPNGRWVAFSRCNALPPLGPGGWSLWKVPITGGSATQLTAAAPRTDFYAQWSPDGRTIYFQRQDATIGPQWTLWRVSADGGTESPVFIPSSSPDVHDAVQPALSPDGEVLLAGFGKRDNFTRNVVTHTLDPDLPSPDSRRLVGNYRDTTFAVKGNFPILSPRLSPNGTRLALRSKQIWASRRNMNTPPAFTSVTSSGEGTQALDDSTSTLTFTFSCLPGTVNTITVSASDVESDALTYHADLLPTGMSWNASTRTLTYIATFGVCPSGVTYYVPFRVTSRSGGTDSFIALIVFPSGTLAPDRADATSYGASSIASVLESNTLRLSLPPSFVGQARLNIYDLAGRKIASVNSGGRIAVFWDGRDQSGTLVRSGIYMWRLESDRASLQGRMLVLR